MGKNQIKMWPFVFTQTSETLTDKELKWSRIIGTFACIGIILGFIDLLLLFKKPVYGLIGLPLIVVYDVWIWHSLFHRGVVKLKND